MKTLSVLVFSIVTFTGCATYTPNVAHLSSKPHELPTYTLPRVTETAKGFYHIVKRGQTLWKISKIYNVDIERIVESNRLCNSSRIDVGQRLFIPEGISERPPQDYQDFIWPLKGKIISFFGSKKDNVRNKGIDISAAHGTPIKAVKDGIVSFCSNSLRGFGKTLIIKHHNGYSSVYAYNSENLVELNQNIKQSQIIARVGSTGRARESSLHFEIRKGHKAQNPFYYLP